MVSVDETKVTSLTIETECDSFRTKLCSINLERGKSCGVSKAILNRVKHDGCKPHHQPPTSEAGDIPKGSSITWAESTSDTSALHMHTMEAAWAALKESIVYFKGQPIGTLAAADKSQAELNYDQVFMRDFVLSALAFLMNGESLILENFLLETARLQSREKMVDLFKLGQGVMPASFKVRHSSTTKKTETLIADLGEIAIGRVAPVDSGLWWNFLLRAYTEYTKDKSLADSPHCQRAMRLILKPWLSEGFDTSPALLCSDGCSMIDRRMGIYGYPLEIQALFFMALRCASSYVKDSDGDFMYQISKRIKGLSYHLLTYYWLDFQRLNDKYRYKTEEYSQTALNKFNVIPESIPDWIFDFMTSRGGYFIGNVSPARMDFRWFCLGNFIAILSSLATSKQAEAILDLVEERWEELNGEMPLKICYPSMENQEWKTVIPCDLKNERRAGSYSDAYTLPLMFCRTESDSPMENGANHASLTSKEVLKSTKLFSETSVSADKKRKSKSGRSPPYVSVACIATVILIMLSMSGLASASTRQSCEVASLATNIRLFCSESHPSSLCCDAVNAAVARQDDKKCLCLVGSSPDIITMGFSAQSLISLSNLCSHHEDDYDCDLENEKTRAQESAVSSNADEERSNRRGHRQRPLKSDPKDGGSDRMEASAEDEPEEGGPLNRSKARQHVPEEDSDKLSQQHHWPASHSGSSSSSHSQSQHRDHVPEENGDKQSQQHDWSDRMEASAEDEPEEGGPLNRSKARQHVPEEDSDKLSQQHHWPESHSGSSSSSHSQSQHRDHVPEENGDKQSQQHDWSDSHANSTIKFLSGVIIVLLGATLTAALALKYKRQRTDFRQLLSVALAAALSSVRAQAPVAAQATSPVQALQRPLDVPQIVNGLPVPSPQAQPPLAVFPGPMETVSLLSFVLLEKMRRKLWA